MDRKRFSMSCPRSLAVTSPSAGVNCTPLFDIPMIASSTVLAIMSCTSEERRMPHVSTKIRLPGYLVATGSSMAFFGLCG